MPVTSRALLHAGPLLSPPPPGTLSSFPIINRLYFLHLFSSYLFFFPFTVVHLLCFYNSIYE